MFRQQLQKGADVNKTDMHQQVREPYAALIGIDWASRKHDVWHYDTGSRKQSHQVVEHTPEALSAWTAQLRSDYPGQFVAVCLEQSRGALIQALSGCEFITFYPVNPATLAKYREAFAPSGAKDDPTDSKLLMELLLKHRDKLRAWKPQDEQTRSIGLLNEDRRKYVDLRTKLALRLQAVLRGYFPQALDLLAENLTSELACAFIQKWPELEMLKRAKPETVRAFYYRHNYRRADLVESYIEKIRTAAVLTGDRAVVCVSMITAQALARQIRLTSSTIEQYDEEIYTLFEKHPDAFIFKSLPGSGRVLGPRLLSALGSERDRYDDACELQTYSGIAPVVERSGKQEWIHCRSQCPTFLRQSFHEFANCSRHFSVWAEAYYELQRERGKKHHAAVRSLAFKWQRIIFRCWKARISYTEEQYIQALKENGSPLWLRIEALKAA